MSRVTCHMSGVTCQVSQVRCHVSCIFSFLFSSYKLVELVSRVSVINGAYPSSYDYITIAWLAEETCQDMCSYFGRNGCERISVKRNPGDFSFEVHGYYCQCMMITDEQRGRIKGNLFRKNRNCFFYS